MRKLVLIATILLGAFAMAEQAAAMVGTANLANENSYDQVLAAQVVQYIAARLKAAPCPCEASEAYFVRIGETYPVRKTHSPELLSAGADADLYSQILATQAVHYRRIWATLAASIDPDARLATHELQPGSMAANSGAQSSDQDSYSLTVALQANMNRLAEAVHRP